MRTILFFLITFPFFIVNCTSSNSSGAGLNSGESVCSLEGTWSRCQANDATSSGRVTLTVTNGILHETIEDFSSDPNCGGTSSGQFDINAAVTLGTLGASGFVSGGTDISLVPDVDFASCGSGQPVYTVIKFNGSCSEFQAGAGTPVCSPGSRPTTLDSGAFVKQ